jgi:hypothetical protein
VENEDIYNQNLRRGTNSRWHRDTTAIAVSSQTLTATTRLPRCKYHLTPTLYLTPSRGSHDNYHIRFAITGTLSPSAQETWQTEKRTSVCAWILQSRKEAAKTIGTHTAAQKSHAVTRFCHPPPQPGLLYFTHLRRSECSALSAHNHLWLTRCDLSPQSPERRH